MHHGRRRVPSTHCLQAFILAVAMVTGVTRGEAVMNATTECLIGFDGVSDALKGGGSLSCTDCDPTCDADGVNSANGSCVFELQVCVNRAEGACTAADLKKVTVKGKCGASALAPSVSGMCGSEGRLTVNLKKRGRKPGKCKVVAKTLSRSKPKRVDKDTLMLVCSPRPAGEACPTTTTTTTTTTSTTTTPTLPAACPAPPAGPSGSLSFTTSAGTLDCGPKGLTSPPAPPFSGEIDSDTAGTTKITDLGLGCLYFGGGNATAVPPGRIPDCATNFLAVSGSTLSASPGVGPGSCTQGAGPTTHCINNNSTASCTGDLDCGGAAGACALDANCFFGPPLPILTPPPSGALTTCVLNVIQTDASGTVDVATGQSSVSLPLISRVYITGNTASPCPKCIGNACTYGKNAGAACTPTGSLQTSIDCAPNLLGFQGPLAVDLTPLTTGSTAKTDAAGIFCAGQDPNGSNGKPGAFGLSNARRVAQMGTPGGDLSDGTPHASVLASVFCIPATGNFAVDAVADIPGPGAIGLNGNAQIIP